MKRFLLCSKRFSTAALQRQAAAVENVKINAIVDQIAHLNLIETASLIDQLKVIRDVYLFFIRSN
jgi:hypothetical protein